MSKIKEFYSDYIKGKIILDFLLANTLPTAEEINKRFDFLTEGKDLSKPQFSAKDFAISPGDKGSASKFNLLINTIRDDLDIAYRTLSEIGEVSVSDFDRTLSKLKNIQGLASSLRDKIQEKLLAIKDTDGYFELVSDTFVDMSAIDPNLTTATVDLKSQSVYSGLERSSVENDLERIFFDEDEVKLNFMMITRKDLLRLAQSPNTKIYDCLSDKSSPWLAVAVMRTNSKPVTAQLIIESKIKAFDLSRIILLPHDSMGGGRMSVGIQYSKDGVNWAALNEDPIKNITGRTVWLCDVEEVRSLKFIITKHGYDVSEGDGYGYSFGFERIELYNSTYIADVTSMVTLPRAAIQDDGTYQEFNKISLEVCEQIPTQCQLDYEVAFGYFDGTNIEYEMDLVTGEKLFHPIDPVNRRTKQKPVVLEVVQTRQEAHRDIHPLNELKSHKLNAINEIEILDRPLATNSQESELIVLRDLKNYSAPYTRYGIPKGWYKEADWYCCYMNLTYARGIDLDFGPKPIEINDSLVSGWIHLDPGLHKIRIREENWYDFENPSPETFGNSPSNPLGYVKDFDSIRRIFSGTGTYSSGGNSTVELFDPLYPYNHKYLIEGLLFHSAISKDKALSIAYPDAGFIIIATYLMKACSNFDMLRNAVMTRTLFYYSIIDIDKSELNLSGLGRGIAVYRSIRDIADSFERVEGLPSGSINPDEEFMLIEQIPSLDKNCRSLTQEEILNNIGMSLYDSSDEEISQDSIAEVPDQGLNIDSYESNSGLPDESKEKFYSTGENPLYTFTKEIENDILIRGVLAGAPAVGV